MNLIWDKEDWKRELGIDKPKDFRFETVEEAEKWYEENLDNDSNNMNEAFEGRRDSWISDNSDNIRECYEEDHPVVKDDEIGRDNQLER